MEQYIPKSALVAEIRKRLLPVISDKHYDEWEKGRDSERIAILDIINTLEVKEVDLNNDLFEEVYSHLNDIKDTADRMTSGNFMHHRAAIKFSANVIEKVLGLIGLKAQKGE